ncbi:MAG TPA: NAD-dependent epimerase/dehydratase family protein [Gaiellaceae bacterium]|nr:NAD-dependent epimerase/dehydratase family protein [Gaiellaceae bacterium]
MVIAVTGHRGFLGGAIARRLAEAGWDVTGLGRPEVEIPSNAFDDALDRLRPDVVVHAAGPASVPASFEDPAADHAGSVDVLRALVERLGDARLVYLSSAAVYGQPASLPVGEAAPLQPMSPYGRHRAECERLLADAGARATVLRIFSAYGEGLRRQVLWDICRQARHGAVELAGDGGESRDFVHASDVAAAVAAAVRRAEFAGEAFNVASGVETTIAELARLLVAALGAESEIRFTGQARAGDPRRWRGDVTRAAARLGYRPAVSIEEGAGRYASWFARAS